MTSKMVLTEQKGRVLTIRLNNPPQNFFTNQMVEDLISVVSKLEKDSSVGAVIITGALDDVFIAHFDLREIYAPGTPKISFNQSNSILKTIGALNSVPGVGKILEKTPAGDVVGYLEFHELFQRMHCLDKVFIAAINGFAMGGGCELALGCDIRLMADADYQIGLPECLMGIMPGAGGTQRLPRIIGQSRALELMLEGRGLSPKEALDIGLIHHVIKPELLLEEAQKTAERLARRSPITVSQIKKAVYQGGSGTIENGLAMERAGFIHLASTKPAKRAIKAFLKDTSDLENLTPSQYFSIVEKWQEGKVVDMNK